MRFNYTDSYNFQAFFSFNEGLIELYPAKNMNILYQNFSGIGLNCTEFPNADYLFPACRPWYI
jgi:hypothetical protein